MTAKKQTLEEKFELLMEQNAALQIKVEALAASKEIEKPLAQIGQQPKKGNKFVKTRILDNDGDLVWGLIEVPKDDKRKSFDPRTNSLKNSNSDAGKGNPMANAKAGSNDVVVTGL
jgi:hypothetical protein